MSANTESLQSKKPADVLSSKLKFRMQLFARKYFTGTGVKQLLIQIVMYLLVFGLAFVFIYPFLSRLCLNAFLLYTKPLILFYTKPGELSMTADKEIFK